MTSRMNGYETDRIPRPSSEQMADLHVYLVPPDIWREKFNNALNQHINDTVSLGFIRVHPETKVYALRDEIEQQLGSDLVPREFVFLKSVGRSLTRLKARQEATMKVKHFLPPQAYAPELYLLEATPEVKQAIAASSSEGSTRPDTRTSYDFEYARQSDENAVHSHMPNGVGGYQTYYPTLPKIPTHITPPSSIHPRSSPQVRQNPQLVVSNTPGPRSLPDPENQSAARTHTKMDNNTSSGSKNPPIEAFEHQSQRRIRTPPTSSLLKSDPYSHSVPQISHPTSSVKDQPPKIVLSEWTDSDNSDVPNQTHPTPKQTDSSPYANHHSINRPAADIRTTHTSSDPHPDPSQHHMVNSPRRGRTTDRPYEDQYLPPLSATPPHSAAVGDDKNKRTNQHSNRNNLEEDSGIAGFSPDTYRGNDSNVLDRRKDGDETNRHKVLPPVQTNRNDQYAPAQNGEEDKSNWNSSRDQNFDKNDRKSPVEVGNVSRNDNDDKDHEDERNRIDDEVKQMKNSADEDLTRYPSPPPLRLASPERESASAKERKRREKEQLLQQLEQAREARKAAERMREELVKQAKLMQNKTQNKRNHARDVWKKRYFEEKKRTGPLEEQMNKLRHELDIIHKRLLSTLEGPKEKATKLGDMKYNKGPAQQKPLNNFKVQATRLQHEIEDIRRRVEHAKMRLTSEMKGLSIQSTAMVVKSSMFPPFSNDRVLRNQAETELRALRAELTQKKINLTLSRNSHLTTYAPPASDVNLITSRSTAITPRS